MPCGDKVYSVVLKRKVRQAGKGRATGLYDVYYGKKKIGRNIPKKSAATDLVSLHNYMKKMGKVLG